MKPNNMKLKNKMGSSIVEFLVLAPLLMALCFLAYDFNKRIEQQQLLNMVARNITIKGNVSENNDYHTEITKDTSLNHNLLGHYPHKLLEQNDVGSYRTIDHTLSRFARVGTKTYQHLRSLVSPLGLLPDDQIRESRVATSQDMSSVSIRMLTSLQSQAGYIGTRYFLRADHGYHLPHYENQGLVGVALGLDARPWRKGNDTAKNSQHLTHRCLTRFYADHTCSPSLSVTGFSRLNSDAFAYKVLDLASASALLQTIAYAGAPFSAGGTIAVSEGIKLAIGSVFNEVTEATFDTLTNSLEQAVLSKVKTAISDQVLQKLQDIAKDQTFHDTTYIEGMGGRISLLYQDKLPNKVNNRRLGLHLHPKVEK